MEARQNSQATPGNPISQSLMKKFHFTGSFGHFFIYALGLFILSVFSFGIVLPYFIYWINKYFFSNLELDGKKILFKGIFGDIFCYVSWVVFPIYNHIRLSFSILDLLEWKILL